MSVQSKLRIETAEVFEPLLQPARYKGAHGGRGSGKSQFFAGLEVEDALRFPGETGEGLRAVNIREVQKDLKHSSKSLIERVLAAHNLGERDGFKVYEAVIKTPKDGIMIFNGMQDHTADSVKSLDGFHRAWWEEAQTASLRSMELLIPTIRWEDRKRGLESELWFSWNPTNDDDPVDVFLRRDPPEDAIVVQANWSDNYWFPDVLKREMERSKLREPDRYLHTWEGEYRTVSDSRIFKRFRKEELTPPANIIWHYGLDFGFATDPTAGLRVCIPKPGVLYVDHEIYEVGLATEAHPSILGQIPGASQNAVTADSARPETIDYIRRHGFPRIRGARKGAGSVEDGIAFLQGFDIVYHPRCVNLERELLRYSYKIDKRTEDIVPVPADMHNHLIDALRYATERLHVKGRFKSHEAKDEQQRTRPTDYGGHESYEDSYKVV